MEEEEFSGKFGTLIVTSSFQTHLRKIKDNIEMIETFLKQTAKFKSIFVI